MGEEVISFAVGEAGKDLAYLFTGWIAHLLLWQNKENGRPVVALFNFFIRGHAPLRGLRHAMSCMSHGSRRAEA